jgi:hypothetical protein
MPPHSGAVTAMILVFPSERVDLGLFRITLPSLGVLLFPPCERRGSVADCLDVVGEAAFDCFGAECFLLRLKFLDLGFDDCELVSGIHDLVSLVEWIA